MGSCAIDAGRLLGAVAEAHNDENGILWPALTDADLIGLPLRITVSRRSLEAGGVETKAARRA